MPIHRNFKIHHDDYDYDDDYDDDYYDYDEEEKKEELVTKQVSELKLEKEVQLKPATFKVQTSKKQNKIVTSVAVEKKVLNKPTETFATETIVIHEDHKHVQQVNKVIISKELKQYDPTAVLNAYKHQRDDSKQLINLIVIGHVDVGKSTLMGNMLHQLGYVSDKKLTAYKREAQKLGKASFAYAWILDEGTEERARGVTTDVAHAYFETENRKVRLLDAPGHKDFVPKMIAGASQADSALLVINATVGEFETGFNMGGQTREHASLIRIYGITNVFVVVNKMDTVDWSESRYNDICDQVNKFLKSMKLTAQFCPISGLLGINLTKSTKRPQELTSWYKGPSLIELIDTIKPPQRALEKPLRFTITNFIKNSGSSTIEIAGRVDAGALSSSQSDLDKVVCMPGRINCRVKSIKINSNVAKDDGTCSEIIVTHAFDGDEVIISLSGSDVSDSLQAGHILCHPEYPISFTNRIRAKLLVFSLVNNKVITRGFTAMVYFQSLNVPVTFEKLHSTICREGKTEVIKTKPRLIAGSCLAEVDLRFNSPICIEAFDDYKQLGKFSIRDSGNTIAGGTVIKVLKSKEV